jgi:hypothetical protein
LIPQAHGIDAEIGFRRVRLGMLFQHSGMYDPQLSASRFEIRARREPAEQLSHAMHAARDHGGREVMRAGDHVGNDLGFGRIRHRRFQYAYDGCRARAETDGLANYRRVAFERRGPEAVREDGGARGAGAIVAHIEQAAQDRVKAHHLEIRAAHHARRYRTGFAETDHREADGREIPERGNSLHSRAQVLDLR